MSTLAQSRDALRTANQVRTALSEVRRELAAGTLTVADAINDPRAARMTAFDVIVRQRGYGHKRARRLLRLADVPELKRVEDLTPRQAQQLAVFCGQRT